jgi:protein-S-isoprenylcysteine O-methyltransferase Ste14
MAFMHQIVIIIIFLAYGLLIFELVFLHVPSVASVYQLIWSNKSIINYSNEKLERGSLYNVLQWPALKKLVLLALPTLISILTGLLPLFYVIIILFNVSSWQDLNNYYFGQNLAGVFLVGAGRMFTMYATLNIRNQNRQKDSSFDLKTSRFFGISRNPILVGMYIMYVGMFVIFPQLLFAAGLFIYVLNMHFRILLEEDFLEFQFGEPFKIYKQKVKRYI